MDLETGGEITYVLSDGSRLTIGEGTSVAEAERIRQMFWLSFAPRGMELVRRYFSEERNRGGGSQEIVNRRREKRRFKRRDRQGAIR